MICYRQMVNTDCGQVAALLQENAQSRQGGLLGEYPLKKVENMFAHALTVIIAQDGDVIAGVVFSFPVQSAQISPVTAVISQQFAELLENNWFYGYGLYWGRLSRAGNLTGAVSAAVCGKQWKTGCLY